MAALTFQGRFRQAGGVVDHTPSSAVAAGEVVVVGSGLIGFAHTAIAASALGSLIVAGVAEFVKVTGTIAIGIPVYWDEDGDPLGGSAGTGCLTATSTSNSFVGFMVTAAADADQFGVVYMVPAIAVTTTGNLAGVIADPADAGAISVTGSGSCSLVSVGADETRTLTIPTILGQQISMQMQTDGGDIVLTVASAINETGNNTITFDNTGETLGLVAVNIGGTLAWRVMWNDGAGLSTV